MKRLIAKTFALSAIVALIASCETDDATGDQILNGDYAPVNATISVDDLNTTESDGDDILVPITINLDREAPFKTYYSVDYEGSSMTEEADFSGPHWIAVDEYTTSVTEYISIHSDCEYEDIETLQVTVGEETTGNVVVNPASFNVTLDNYVSEGMDMYFSWDGTASVPVLGGNVDVDLCSIADIDVLVYDEFGDDTGIYDGATGNCPEEFVISPDWGDGVYELVATVYSFEDTYGGYNIRGADIMFDFTSMYSQCGGEDEGTTVRTDAFDFNGGTGQDILVAVVTIANGEVSIDLE